MYWLTLLLLFGIPLVTESVDESQFKKCNDSGFCRRNRQAATDRSYRLIANTVAIEATEITATIRNDAVEKDFLLRLSSVGNSTIRIEVTEPSAHRFRVKDILLDDSLSPSKLSVQRTPTSLLVTFGDPSEVTVQFDPFLIEAKRNGKTKFLINADSMFHVEHSGQAIEPETFKSFTDSMPKGPQAISLDLTYVAMDHLYGLPEHSSNLSLTNTIDNGEIVSEPYRLYNLDVFEYNLDSPFGLYGSIPFLIGQSPFDSVGAFWLNSAEMYVDIWEDSVGTHTQWISESGVLDLFLMMGPTTKDVMKQYSVLTGTTAMPQYFALGYHQCRWNYNSETDVKQVDSNFDLHRLPYDVLWLDIEHTDGKKYMTWDAAAFPDSVAMQEDLASRGRKIVVIVDPHIKKDDRYRIYSEAKKKGYFVKNKDKEDFVGHCWPGSSSYLDVMRDEVRAWWADQFSLKKYEGSTKYLYVWNDMNEPSVFDGPEVTMQKDLLHSGNVEHRDVHNLYGFYYHWATREGLELRGRQIFGEEGDRPFVLSRAYFAGSQRLGPIWTGDNAAKWEDLKVSVPMLLSNNLAGMAFCGADIGGFFGDPDEELLTRWYQLGVFYPFMRAHAHIKSKRREPYLFSYGAVARIRKALRERYALLPYLYTLFWNNHLSGEPIIRPMWYHFPEDDLFEHQEQFMMGPAIMVAPVLEEGAGSIEVAFPGGSPWYDAWTGEQIDRSIEVANVRVDLENIPFYYRGGSVVVRKERPRRSSVATMKDPVTLIVAIDEKGEAKGELYVDDGHSYRFRNKEYLHRRFVFQNSTLTSSSLSPGTEFISKVEVEKIVVLGLGAKKMVTLQSMNRTVESSLGSLRLEAGAPTVGLVVKKPGVKIDHDWSLHFS